MLNKSKTWYSTLTKSSKVLVWTLFAISSFSVVSAASNTNSGSKLESPTPAPMKQEQRTESVSETQPVAFSTTTINDANLEQGRTELRTAGVNGIKTLTYQVVYEDKIEKSRNLTREEVTTQPVTQVTAIGTKKPYIPPAPKPAPAPRATPSNCDPNYTPCVPNVSYDLDCPDIGFSVTVIGSDPHRFDANNDGAGCESY